MSAPNWLGLLRWTMSHTDGTNDSKYAEMSAEDKEWLERVMKEAVRDDPQRMNDVMTYLKDMLQGDGEVGEEEQATLENNLEELREIVEQIDMAQVFAKFGGIDVLVEVIACNRVPHHIQALAAAVLATVAQNNITVQEMLFKSKTVDKLMQSFVRTNSFTVATKVLMAISSLTRGHASAEEYFVVNFLNTVVRRSMESRANNIFSRLFFFLNALIASDTASPQRVQSISTSIMPHCFDIFASTISIDARDNLSYVINSLLARRNLFDSRDFVSQLEHALALREEVLKSNHEEIEEEDKQAEILRINEIKRNIVNAPILPTPSTVEHSSGSEEIQADSQPVLMIAPPSLQASSTIP